MAESELTCYTIGWNFVSSTNQYFPCGPVDSDSSNSTQAQACCYAGDSCLSTGHDYSICHYDHYVEGGTGYYMAGCTDPTWQDPACPKQCTSEYGADVVYDTGEKQWQCCDVTNTTKNCDNPTNDFYIKASEPSLLSTQTQITATAPSAEVTGIGSITGPSPYTNSSDVTASSSSSSSSSSSTTINGSSSTVSSTTTRATNFSTSNSLSTAPSGSTSPSTQEAASTSSQKSSSTSISSGAKAGIAVGVIVGALLIASLIFFFIIHRRRKTNKNAFAEKEAADRPQDPPTYDEKTVYTPPTFASNSPGWSSPVSYGAEPVYGEVQSSGMHQNPYAAELPNGSHKFRNENMKPLPELPPKTPTAEQLREQRYAHMPTHELDGGYTAAELDAEQKRRSRAM